VRDRHRRVRAGQLLRVQAVEALKRELRVDQNAVLRIAPGLFKNGAAASSEDGGDPDPCSGAPPVQTSAYAAGARERPTALVASAASAKASINTGLWRRVRTASDGTRCYAVSPS
jgi:hypothetical protein